MQLKLTVEEKTKALELVMSENHELKAQLQELIVKTKNLEAENKMLIDRWMLQKMQEAEHLNEVFYVIVMFGIKCRIRFRSYQYTLVSPRSDPEKLHDQEENFLAMFARCL